jgi:glycosyltransferase involved in cell wall biosynthesis
VEATAASRRSLRVACISALREERTIQKVIVQVALCPLIDEILVVVNGGGDRTAELARTAISPGRPRVLVAEVPEALGHDVGRSAGADWALARGAGTMIFLDADFPVGASDLAPFAQSADEGIDLGLNGISGLLSGWAGQGPTASARAALNAFLGRPDLGLDGLVIVPHTLSRRAVETVGAAALAVPPRAYALALLAGLTVKVVHTVNVIGVNRPSPERPRSRSPKEMTEMILGDHLEALAEIITGLGPRGGFSEHGRRRDLIGIPPLAPVT